MSGPGLIAVDAAAWLAIHVITGYAVHRLPTTTLARDRWWWRERRWEGGGRLYVRTLKIRKWKRWLPEAGGVFRGGFDKRRLASTDPAYLDAYLLETRRAELGHWLAMAPAPLFFLWNPWWVAVFMPLYAVAANGPCIASQRFNRLRLARVQARRAGLAPSP